MSFLLGPISGALVAGGVSSGAILAYTQTDIDLNIILGLLWVFKSHADAVRSFDHPPKTNSLIEHYFAWNRTEQHIREFVAQPRSYILSIKPYVLSVCTL
jgi:hypothetical protein